MGRGELFERGKSVRDVEGVPKGGFAAQSEARHSEVNPCVYYCPWSPMPIWPQSTVCERVMTYRASDGARVISIHGMRPVSDESGEVSILVLSEARDVNRSITHRTRIPHIYLNGSEARNDEFHPICRYLFSIILRQPLTQYRCQLIIGCSILAFEKV